VLLVSLMVSHQPLLVYVMDLDGTSAGAGEALVVGRSPSADVGRGAGRRSIEAAARILLHAGTASRKVEGGGRDKSHGPSYMVKGSVFFCAVHARTSFSSFSSSLMLTVVLQIYALPGLISAVAAGRSHHYHHDDGRSGGEGGGGVGGSGGGYLAVEDQLVRDASPPPPMSGRGRMLTVRKGSVTM